MTTPPEWQQFFDLHAPEYLQNGFTSNTLAEVDFILETLRLPDGGRLPPGSRLLDVGCGVGRHTLELARRGYQMTGVDLSPGMLAQARQAADAEHLTVELIQADASKFLPPGLFDGVYCLCEGAFSLLSASDDPLAHDQAILGGIYRALKPGGRLLLSCLNGMRYLRMYSPEDVAAGKFDPIQMTECYSMEVDTPDGKRAIPVRERGYVPTELRLLMQVSGFTVETLWGGTAGMPFHRPPELDEMELMVLGKKG
jgi:SAM-dependent methyltransferase